MERRSVRFPSEGFLLDAELCLPAEASSPLPALVACSGYTGLMGIHPARFARALVPRGYACLAFDYRGFGHSEGERGRLVPQEQVEDARAAVAFLTGMPEVDPARVAVVGWGLGGGVAVAAAAADERVGAVVSVNGVGDGERTTRRLHDRESWALLQARIAAHPEELVDPFEILPLDDVTRAYVLAELYKADGYGTGVTLESGGRLLRFRPELVVDRIAPRPLLLVHGRDNRLYPPSESEELYRRAGEPKRLELVEGGHTEWMRDDHPTFRRLVELVDGFLAGVPA